MERAGASSLRVAAAVAGVRRPVVVKDPALVARLVGGDWSVARRRRLHRRHGFLTADQAADLDVMRWTDEARLLGDPERPERMVGLQRIGVI